MLSKLLRLGEGRMVKRLRKVADYVNTLSDDVEKLTDAELRAKTDEFKRRLADEKTRKHSTTCYPKRSPSPARRLAVLDQRPFDVQVMGAAACTWATSPR
ncbi:secA DEAD-like domain protein [Mycobacterium kansasii]|uniref:SecA DEAD-like domain protein n=1 Tax=Mycobacterium kansasii TaxID=1768 RepID=A0A1V3W9T1_MYCKA|nr:secA DEAD-like domain protein [Mycobacterium kansasii]